MVAESTAFFTFDFLGSAEETGSVVVIGLGLSTDSEASVLVLGKGGDDTVDVIVDGDRDDDRPRFSLISLITATRLS